MSLLTENKATYQTLSIDEESKPLNTEIVVPSDASNYSKTNEKWIFTLMIFALNFIFYFYCIYRALAPIELFLSNELYLQRPNNAIRQLDLTDPSVGDPHHCTPANTSTMATVGAVAGAALVGATFIAIGLSPLGPIAGGLFAANMGASVTAGSWMALAQAAAMTSTAYATGAAVGAAGGATYACA